MSTLSFPGLTADEVRHALDALHDHVVAKLTAAVERKSMPAKPVAAMSLGAVMAKVRADAEAERIEREREQGRAQAEAAAKASKRRGSHQSTAHQRNL